MTAVSITVSKQGEEPFSIELTEEGASAWVINEIRRLLENGYSLSK